MSLEASALWAVLLVELLWVGAGRRNSKQPWALSFWPCLVGLHLEKGTGSQDSWVLTLGMPLPSSVPQFPHLLNGDNDTELPHSQLVTKELGEPQVKGKEEGKGLVIRAPVNAPPSKPSWSVPKGSPLLLAQGLIAMG